MSNRQQFHKGDTVTVFCKLTGTIIRRIPKMGAEKQYYDVQVVLSGHAKVYEVNEIQIRLGQLNQIRLTDEA